MHAGVALRWISVRLPGKPLRAGLVMAIVAVGLKTSFTALRTAGWRTVLMVGETV